MDWNAFGAIGEVAGAGGVIVTLLFLIRQLKDNTKSMKAAATASYMQAYSGANGRASDQYRAHVIRTAVEDPSALTSDEAMSFNMMMSERVALYESLCSMHLDGSIHDAHWRVARADMASLLQAGAARRAFEALLPMYEECFPQLAAEIRAAMDGEHLLYDLNDAFPTS